MERMGLTPSSSTQRMGPRWRGQMRCLREDQTVISKISTSCIHACVPRCYKALRQASKKLSFAALVLLHYLGVFFEGRQCWILRSRASDMWCQSCSEVIQSKIAICYAVNADWFVRLFTGSANILPRFRLLNNIAREKVLSKHKRRTWTLQGPPWILQLIGEVRVLLGEIRSQMNREQSKAMRSSKRQRGQTSRSITRSWYLDTAIRW